MTELVFTVLAASVAPFGLPLLSSPRLRPAIAQTPTWSAGDGSEEGEHVQDHECERVDLQATSEPVAERVGADGEFARCAGSGGGRTANKTAGSSIRTVGVLRPRPKGVGDLIKPSDTPDVPRAG